MLILNNTNGLQLGALQQLMLSVGIVTRESVFIKKIRTSKKIFCYNVIISFMCIVVLI